MPITACGTPLALSCAARPPWPSLLDLPRNLPVFFVSVAIICLLSVDSLYIYEAHLAIVCALISWPEHGKHLVWWRDRKRVTLDDNHPLIEREVEEDTDDRVLFGQEQKALEGIEESLDFHATPVGFTCP